MTLVGRLAARARALDRSLGLLAAMAFITQLGVSVMLPLLPLYAQSLGATPFVLGLLISGFGVTLAAGQLAAGFMADRIAPRRLVVTGLGVYAAANIAIAISTSAAQLIVYRGVAGLGAGIGQVAERLYIGQVAARARLAFANSIISAAYSAGTVAGPAIGGLLAHVGDLHLPFVVVGLTSFAAAAAGWFLPRPPERIAEPASGVGSERLDGSAPATGTAPAAGSRRRLIVRRIAVLFVAQLALNASFGAFITTYSPFATERLGWTTIEVGIVFSLFGLGSVLLGPLLSRIADRRGRRLFAIIGAAMVVPFVVAYVVEAPRLVLYPLTMLAGAGITVFEAAWFALLTDATDGGRRSRAFSTVVAISSLGIVLGSVTAAQLWERSGDVGLGMVAAGVAIAIAGVSLLAHPADRPQPGDRAATGGV